MCRVKEIMSLLGVSRTTVYKWMKDGMPHIYVGKLLFFDKVEVTAWVKNHERN